MEGSGDQMSGPKCYSPPPSYSIEVFDGKLNTLFKLQTRIERMRNDIMNMQFSDPERKIQFDSLVFLADSADRAEMFLEPFTITYDGAFGQKQYNIFNSVIHKKNEELEHFLHEHESACKDFEKSLQSYTEYINYEETYRVTFQRFDEYKNRVLSYYDSYLKGDHEAILEKIPSKINSINVEFTMKNFEPHFLHLVESEKAALHDAVQLAESKIHALRSEIGVNVLNELSAQVNEAGSHNEFTQIPTHATAEVCDLIFKIRSTLESMTDKKERKLFGEKFRSLLAGANRLDVFYYKELFDEINGAKKGNLWKEEIQRVVNDLVSKSVHPVFKEEQKELLILGKELLSRQKLKEYSLRHLQSRYAGFLEKNLTKIEEERIRVKELSFLKRQIVDRLRSLQYDVTEEMTVIDFEKCDEFLFEVPDQKNYLKLQFKENGSFIYHFLIPEQKDKLSIEQQHQKVSEMKTVCHEFKHVLADLKILGLKLDLIKEVPASENAILQLPLKYQSKIGQKKSRNLKPGKERKLEK